MWHDGTIGPVLWDFVQQLEPMEKYQSMPVIFKSDIYNLMWINLLLMRLIVCVSIYLTFYWFILLVLYLDYLNTCHGSHVIASTIHHPSSSFEYKRTFRSFILEYSHFFFSAITTNKKEAEIRTDIYIFKSSSRFSVMLLCAYARALWFDNFDYSSVVRSSFGFCFWWRVASAHGEK